MLVGGVDIRYKFHDTIFNYADDIFKDLFLFNGFLIRFNHLSDVRKIF